MTKNIEERINFVHSLELPDISTKRASLGHTLTDDDKAGYVVDGGVTSFVVGLSEERKGDVLNSTLLAQLAADKKHDRFDDTENWYKYYVKVMGKVGWVIQEFSFTEYKAAGASFKMDEAVLGILKSIATGNEIAIVKETIDALGSLSDGDGRLVLFSDQSSDLNKGNFQITVANEQEGNVAMKLGAFHFKSSKHETRFLWFGYSSSKMKLFKSAQAITLNLDVYNQIGNTVIEKLGDSAQTFVGDLDI